MSRIYELICTSHNPALVISNYERHEPYVPERSMPALSNHPDCDIMMGVYSNKLVGVGCFGMSLEGPTGCSLEHSQMVWVDVEWLRLLHAASGKVDIAITNPLHRACWSAKRIHAIAREMGASVLWISINHILEMHGLGNFARAAETLCSAGPITTAMNMNRS